MVVETNLYDYIKIRGKKSLRPFYKGINVKTLKVICLAALLILSIFSLNAPRGKAQSNPEIKGPIITNSFAIDKGQYGTIWKIYLEAEDADTEMVKIAAVVDQPGYGHYPTDFILLDPRYRNHLKGYIQWNTFSSRGSALSEGDQITLRVSVIDRAGNESREVAFPFTFVSGVHGQAKLSSPFDQGDIPRIGHIGIDLIGQNTNSVP